MKKLNIALILFFTTAITCLVFLGPFNLYHYFFGEKIVKEKCLFFLKNGENLDDLKEFMDEQSLKRFVGTVGDIRNVKYLGSNAFLIDVAKENRLAPLSQYVWINNSKSKYHYDQEIYKLDYEISMRGYPGYIEHNWYVILILISLALALVSFLIIGIRKERRKRK